jgi:hypothetical protein
MRFVIPQCFAAPQAIERIVGLRLLVQGQRDSCDQVFTGEIVLPEMPLGERAERSC